MMQQARASGSTPISRDAVAAMIVALRQTVEHRWESVDQIIREQRDVNLGDPLTPGTGAWHLRHILEIFRLHARTTLAHLLVPAGSAALAHTDASLDAIMPVDAAPIPAQRDAVRNELLRDINAFAHALLALDEPTLNRAIIYGPEMDLLTMLALTDRHITWHAAAVHYWCRWRGPTSSPPASTPQ